MKNIKILIPYCVGVLLLAGACNIDNKDKQGTNSPPPTTSDSMATMKDSMANVPTEGNNPVPPENSKATTPSTAESKKTTPAATVPNKTRKGHAYVPVTGTSTKEKMEVDKEGVYHRPEVMPSYPGGEETLNIFVEKHVQYPQEALDNNIQGKVMISLIVDSDEKIHNPTVVSTKIGYGLEEEAVKIVQQMPAWSPGRVKGKNVKTRVVLPISFQIVE